MNLKPRLAKPDTYHIDTSNVLFILSGAFVGLDKIIERRISKAVGKISLLCLDVKRLVSQWDSLPNLQLVGKHRPLSSHQIARAPIARLIWLTRVVLRFSNH